MDDDASGALDADEVTQLARQLGCGSGLTLTPCPVSVSVSVAVAVAVAVANADADSACHSHLVRWAEPELVFSRMDVDGDGASSTANQSPCIFATLTSPLQ